MVAQSTGVIEYADCISAIFDERPTRRTSGAQGFFYGSGGRAVAQTRLEASAPVSIL